MHDLDHGKHVQEHTENKVSYNQRNEHGIQLICLIVQSDTVTSLISDDLIGWKINFNFILHRLTKRHLLKLGPSSVVSFPTLKKPTTTAKYLRRCFQTAAISYLITGSKNGAILMIHLHVHSSTTRGEVQINIYCQQE